MTSLLSIGSRSLSAAQGTLSTIAHNIANANTQGYSRQEAVLSTAPGLYTGAGFFGQGVNLTTVRRQYDQFLTAAVQTNTAQASADSARSSALGELDGVFGSGSLGIGAAVDATFAAASDLANRPADTTTRQAYVASAAQLATRVTAVGKQLADMGRRVDSRLTQSASDVNARLTDIKSLNTQIAQAQATGQPPNDLLDQRDAALQSLNSLMGVSSVAAPDGSINLFTASGAPLLVGSQQATLKAVADPADASRTSLQLMIGNTAQPLDQNAMAGGSMAGLLQFRNDDLASATNQIGRLAVVVADRFNSAQANGVDATGTPGAALFAVPTPVTQPNSANSGSGALTASVTDSSALKASDYRVSWDGAAYTVTRLSDGQASTPAGFPATVDGLQFSAAGSPASGDSWLVRPFSAAATGMAAKALSPRQVATGYAATIAPSSINQGTAKASSFQVVAQGASTATPVTISFNSPPTTFNVTGLASGNLTNVPYSAGQTVPASPATWNGWSVVLDGAPAAGDSFAVKPNTSPASDNRNALALGTMADLKLVDGATLNESYAALVGDVGSRVQGAADASSLSGSLHADAITRQQNVSGVNLDEEASNLLRFQQAYQASAKLIQASQTLFDALLAATGR
ncbi:MAG: flagellar hook-associated protein FlgK [Burkholderiaceae bacterium]|nr:flagellar hook-associated protein FlgK [Burkholderiaceae bacterium]